MLITNSSRLRRSETRYRVSARVNEGERQEEQGFLLLGLVVAIFLILLVLGVAAPRVAHELRREREVETVRRGNQYVRAIEVYYAKMGSYPGSMEQLEKSNNIRFLRKRYVDPLTGKDDWRVIPVGQAKTTVKGFFGQPLAGIASSGLGANAGSASPGGTGTPIGGTSSPSAFGTPSSGGTGGLGTSGSSGSSFGSSGSSFGSSGSSFGSSSGSSFGTPGSSSPGSSGSGAGSSSGIGSQSATSFTGGTGPFVGVGLVKDGNSIMTLNEQTTYPTWEFIYDPRIEQLKAKASLFGGGMATSNASSFGSSSGPASGPGGLNSGPGAGTGSQPANGSSGSGSFGGGSFGSGSGGFGSGGFGSGSSSPTPTPNSPQ